MTDIAELSDIVRDKGGSLQLYYACDAREYWIGVTWIINPGTKFAYRFAIQGPDCPTPEGAAISLRRHLEGIRVI